MSTKSLKTHIPKSFELKGQEFKVKVGANIKSEGNLGLMEPIFNEIKVRTEFDGRPIPKDQIHQSLYHEISHAILFSMNQHELNANEEFVDNLGAMIWQFIKSHKL